jgi:hypothetical protein
MKTQFLSHFLAGVRGAAVITSLVLAPGVRAQTGSIAVSDPRPLAKAADELERLSGVPIHYEDVRYSHPSDVVDVTEQVARPEGRAKYPNVRILIPRGGDLRVVPDVDKATGKVKNLDAALAELLSAHVGNGLPGVYAARNVNGAHIIVPKKVLQKNGALQPVSSVLDSPIDFPFQSRTALETLEIILSDVSTKSGYKVSLGTAPLRGLALMTVSLGATSESAQSVLLRLLEKSPVTLSYRLFYSPSQNYYLFNVHVLGSSEPPQQPAPAIATVHPSSPKFVKK